MNVAYWRSEISLSIKLEDLLPGAESKVQVSHYSRQKAIYGHARTLSWLKYIPELLTPTPACCGASKARCFQVFPAVG